MKLTKTLAFKLLALTGTAVMLASCVGANSYDSRTAGLVHVPESYIYNNYLELVAESDDLPPLPASVFTNNNHYLATIVKGDQAQQVSKSIPGAYALAGYSALLHQQYAQARSYFNQEIKAYPESQKYVNMLLKKIPKSK